VRNGTPAKGRLLTLLYRVLESLSALTGRGSALRNQALCVWPGLPFVHSVLGESWEPVLCWNRTLANAHGTSLRSSSMMLFGAFEIGCLVLNAGDGNYF
jgi:hypothetical protein